MFNSSCPYPELKLIDNAPIIPINVHNMLFATLIPAVWYKIMDKEVDKVLKKRDELEKLLEYYETNILPKKAFNWSHEIMACMDNY